MRVSYVVGYSRVGWKQGQDSLDNIEEIPESRMDFCLFRVVEIEEKVQRNIRRKYGGHSRLDIKILATEDQGETFRYLNAAEKELRNKYLNELL